MTKKIYEKNSYVDSPERGQTGHLAYEWKNEEKRIILFEVRVEDTLL